MSLKQPYSCGFCGKRQDEVRKLIAGPIVFICDECVRMCMHFVQGAGAMAEPDRTLLILDEIRAMNTRITVIDARLTSIDGRMRLEFGEIQDRLRRLDERIDGFFTRVKALEGKPV